MPNECRIHSTGDKIRITFLHYKDGFGDVAGCKGEEGGDDGGGVIVHETDVEAETHCWV